MTAEPTADERRFPRRLLLAVPGAAAAAGVATAVAAPATAAPAAATWKLGGNLSVNTDGTNYLGTRNAAPLIVKTTRTEGTEPVERMPIEAAGKVGIGTPTPSAALDVRNNDAVTVQGVTSSAVNTTVGVLGAASTPSANGAGVKGTHAGAGHGIWAISVEGYGLKAEGVTTANALWDVDCATASTPAAPARRGTQAGSREGSGSPAL